MLSLLQLIRLRHLVKLCVCFFHSQVKCRILVSCAIERLHFNSHIIDTYRIIQMIDHIAVRFADVPSKNYQHYTTIKEFIAAKSRSNVKIVVRIAFNEKKSISQMRQRHNVLLLSFLAVILLELDSICRI